MVVVLHGHAPVGHLQADVVAQIVGGVLGQGGVVAVVVGDLIALGGTVGLLAGVPLRLGGVHLKGGLVGLVLKADAVEEIELELRADDHLVGDARLPHILLGPLGDRAGVLAEAAVLRLVDDHHVAGHGEGGDLCEGVQLGGAGVGDEDHVALFHRGVAKVGAVKADAVLERILAEALGGDGDVMPASLKIDGLEVDHADVLLLAQREDLLNLIGHSAPQSFHFIVPPDLHPAGRCYYYHALERDCQEALEEFSAFGQFGSAGFMRFIQPGEPCVSILKQ